MTLFTESHQYFPFQRNKKLEVVLSYGPDDPHARNEKGRKGFNDHPRPHNESKEETNTICRRMQNIRISLPPVS